MLDDDVGNANTFGKCIKRARRGALGTFASLARKVGAEPSIRALLKVVILCLQMINFVAFAAPSAAGSLSLMAPITGVLTSLSATLSPEALSIGYWACLVWSLLLCVFWHPVPAPKPTHPD